jgi:hypothetical protein
MKEAKPPAHVSILDVSYFSMRIDWVPGAPGDCKFVYWWVEVRKHLSNYGPPDEWFTPSGCTDAVLHMRSITSCIAVGLRSNQFYHVRVTEVCEVTLTTSLPKDAEPGGGATTLPVPSQMPQNVILRPTGMHTMQVTWTLVLNDCEAMKTAVEQRYIGPSNGKHGSKQTNGATGESGADNWSLAKSCDGISSCAEGCTCEGLRQNSQYEFRLKTFCVDSRSDSDWAVSVIEATHPQPASAPTNLRPVAGEISEFNDMMCSNDTVPGLVEVENDGRLLFELPIRWSPGEPGDCLFTKWQVLLTKDGEPEAEIDVGSCSNLVQRDVTQCTLTELRCRTEYSFRVREACANALATSEESSSVYICTGEGVSGSCVTPASTPLLVNATGSGMQSREDKFQIKVVLGEYHECESSHLEVRGRITDTLFNVSSARAWFPVCEIRESLKEKSGMCVCQIGKNSSSGETGACVKQDFQPNTEYIFCARVRCKNTVADSEWSVPSQTVRTRPLEGSVWKIQVSDMMDFTSSDLTLCADDSCAEGALRPARTEVKVDGFVVSFLAPKKVGAVTLARSNGNVRQLAGRELKAPKMELLLIQIAKLQATSDVFDIQYSFKVPVTNTTSGVLKCALPTFEKRDHICVRG